VTVQFGPPFRFEAVKQPSREQQQDAADFILERIRGLHGELSRIGPRGARRAARAELRSRAARAELRSRAARAPRR
jgi:1-acyl-sn-glycerol-3-phosphate acyltransferase